MTDSQLIREVLDGNVECYAEIVNRYERKLLAFVIQLLRSAGLEVQAEDLCQETFYKAYRNLHTFREGDASFSTWLFTIARNSVISELRKHKTNAVALDDTTAHLVTSTEPTPEQHALRQERVSKVRDAINSLPDKQRSALILREYDQLDYQEIASILGQTVSSVKSLLFRARNSVKMQLEGYIGDSYYSEHDRGGVHETKLR